MDLKKLTILHSNDMHGDFLSEVSGTDGGQVGGLALLSGHINKVRHEEENVLYVITGDMVQGSMIDSEYKGLSTMEIMNFLAPDVVTLGNHEFDYGLPHLLFMEKVANFPIVNSNLYIKQYNKRMMKPYYVKKKAGLKIMFTGVITEKVMDQINMDNLIGSFVTLNDAAAEIGRILNAYKGDDIGLTVILTHIGLDSDKELAALLQPEWGVDLIIGGHSHTRMEQPELVNNVLIVQAGMGTGQIGRFDLVVDDETNSIVEWKWKLVEINSQTAEPDPQLLAHIDDYKKEVDGKYSSVLTKFAVKLTHPFRTVETTLGNLIADGFAEMIETDIMLVGSGSIRVKELGPVVKRMDFISCFPYGDNLTRFTVDGKTLYKIFGHIMRKENRGGEGECYQVNSRVQAVFSEIENKLLELKLDQVPVENERLYTLSLQGYHLKNCSAYLGVSEEDLRAAGRSKVISTDSRDVIQEWMTSHQNEIRKIEGRLCYLLE